MWEDFIFHCVGCCFMNVICMCVQYKILAIKVPCCIISPVLVKVSPKIDELELGQVILKSIVTPLCLC